MAEIKKFTKGGTTVNRLTYQSNPVYKLTKEGSTVFHRQLNEGIANSLSIYSKTYSTLIFTGYNSDNEENANLYMRINAGTSQTAPSIISTYLIGSNIFPSSSVNKLYGDLYMGSTHTATLVSANNTAIQDSINAWETEATLNNGFTITLYSRTTTSAEFTITNNTGATAYVYAGTSANPGASYGFVYDGNSKLIELINLTQGTSYTLYVTLKTAGGTLIAKDTFGFTTLSAPKEWQFVGSSSTNSSLYTTNSTQTYSGSGSCDNSTTISSALPNANNYSINHYRRVTSYDGGFPENLCGYYW
jgi:hypothetical protein